MLRALVSAVGVFSVKSRVAANSSFFHSIRYPSLLEEHIIKRTLLSTLVGLDGPGAARPGTCISPEATLEGVSSSNARRHKAAIQAALCHLRGQSACNWSRKMLALAGPAGGHANPGQSGALPAKPVPVARQEISIPYNELLMKPCWVSSHGDETRMPAALSFIQVNENKGKYDNGTARARAMLACRNASGHPGRHY